MNKPKYGDLITIRTTDGTIIEAEVIEWAVSAYEQLWAVCKDEEVIYNINMANISLFTISRDHPNKYKIVNKTLNQDNENEEDSKIVDAQTKAPFGYNIIKKGVNETGEEETKSVPIIISRRIPKQGKQVVEEALSDNNLPSNPIERIKKQAILHQNRIKSTHQAVAEHMSRQDLITPKDNYVLPSFKDSTKK